MTTTTYICDRCKKQVEKRSDLYDIEVTANNNCHNFKVTAKQSGAQWCNPCLHESGFFLITKKEVEQNKPHAQPTLEELITSIVQTIIDNQ